MSPFGHRTARREARRVLEQALHSGRDLPGALTTSVAHLREGRSRALLHRLAQGVSSGRRISDVLADPVFGLLPHELAIVRAGESSSRLPEAFALVQEEAEAERRGAARRRELLLPPIASALGLWVVCLGLAAAPLRSVADLVVSWSAVGPPRTAATQALLFLADRRDLVVGTLLLLPLVALGLLRVFAAAGLGSRARSLSSDARAKRMLAQLVEAGIPLPEANAALGMTDALPRFRPGLDARTLAEDLREEAVRLRDEAARRTRLALASWNAALVLGTGAGVLLVVWALLTPLLSLLAVDPF